MVFSQFFFQEFHKLLNLRDAILYYDIKESDLNIALYIVYTLLLIHFRLMLLPARNPREEAMQCQKKEKKPHIFFTAW